MQIKPNILIITAALVIIVSTVFIIFSKSNSRNISDILTINSNIFSSTLNSSLVSSTSMSSLSASSSFSQIVSSSSQPNIVYIEPITTKTPDITNDLPANIYSGDKVPVDLSENKKPTPIPVVESPKPAKFFETKR